MVFPLPCIVSRLPGGMYRAGITAGLHADDPAPGGTAHQLYAVVKPVLSTFLYAHALGPLAEVGYGNGRKKGIDFLPRLLPDLLGDTLLNPAARFAGAAAIVNAENRINGLPHGPDNFGNGNFCRIFAKQIAAPGTTNTFHNLGLFQFVKYLFQIALRYLLPRSNILDLHRGTR